MDYKEIIDTKASKYADNFNASKMQIEWQASYRGYLDGINSPLAKQITEIEKLEFADKFVKDILKEFHMQKMKLFEKGFDYKSIDEIVVSHLKETTHLRDKLINELKMK